VPFTRGRGFDKKGDGVRREELYGAALLVRADLPNNYLLYS
jgi:hypothetical protein